MSRIIIEMSPSLDGYIAGNGITNEQPFGHAGHRLHRWIGFEGVTPSAVDQEALQQVFANAGAVIIGRRMFDVGIDKWGDDGAFGRPVFVVTHQPRESFAKGPTTFTFVTSIAEALARAKTAAGARDVIVCGGASIAQQCLAAGVVDEMRLHIVPTLLGRGTQLFSALSQIVELEVTSVVPSPNATHMTFKVSRKVEQSRALTG